MIARNSTYTYKGRAVDVKQVGRELGVRYVLEGSVRKAGERVRITGQLIDAATGTHLWADRFDGSWSCENAVPDARELAASCIAARPVRSGGSCYFAVSEKLRRAVVPFPASQ